MESEEMSGEERTELWSKRKRSEKRYKRTHKDEDLRQMSFNYTFKNT